MLATLEEVKDKLGIAGTERDDALLVVLETASARVLESCRYVEADAEAREDTFERVKEAMPFFLTKRPVATVTSVEGRGYGSDSWASLSFDLIDAAKGRIVVVGSDLGWWPPKGPGRKVKGNEWPLVKVTYDVTGIGAADFGTPEPPEALHNAAASLAAYWYQRHLMGAYMESSIGSLGAKLLSDPLPPSFAAELVGHYEAAGATWC